MSSPIQCPSGKHGGMIEQQAKTPAQAWCGTWYRCPPGPLDQHTCAPAVLVASPELLARDPDEALTRAAMNEHRYWYTDTDGIEWCTCEEPDDDGHLAHQADAVCAATGGPEMTR